VQFSKTNNQTFLTQEILLEKIRRNQSYDTYFEAIEFLYQELLTYRLGILFLVNIG